MSRKKRISLKILRPGARSKQFAQRATEFFGPLISKNNASCNLTFFMTWIAPLEYFGKRELFSIESLFKWHRNACLLIISTTMDSLKGTELLRPFLDNGFRVAALSPDYEYLVKGTMAETWLEQLRKGEVDPGEVSIGQNLSNLIRLLVLYKYGGIYMDTDVIVVKSLYSLRNCIGAQTVNGVTHNWTRLNNAVMIFDKKHPVVLEFIREFASTFDGNKWGHNGPYLVSRVVSRVINSTYNDTNHRLVVLSPIAFYPLDWSRIEGLFRGPGSQSNESQWMREKLHWIQKESFAVHLWNRESRGMTVEKGSIIQRIMLNSCLFCNSSTALKTILTLDTS
ncbi:lactosylceramide 4-alpha-galactosyltransferase [Carex littledalei]|uniref:Lactosylceramide 4-alpha-galactosyltransferase n=1 Tax=Carex littledalei TaxID=544730 RepID=A0A833VEB4_9POAL|nr:lactosylceramide 4-alpha-galactosyltransferase [Carex littledalei]